MGDVASMNARASGRPSTALRGMALVAVTWSVAFAGMNVWVQYVLMQATSLSTRDLVGLAVLNAAAVALKAFGVAVVVMALRTPPVRHLRLLLACASAAASTLTLWGVAGFALVTARGSLTSLEPLAGGAVLVPGWTYPAFFLVGAAAFTGAAVHAARKVARPRRWIITGALGGPPVLIIALGLLANMVVPPHLVSG